MTKNWNLLLILLYNIYWRINKRISHFSSLNFSSLANFTFHAYYSRSNTRNDAFQICRLLREMVPPYLRWHCSWSDITLFTVRNFTNFFSLVWKQNKNMYVILFEFIYNFAALHHKRAYEQLYNEEDVENLKWLAWYISVSYLHFLFIFFACISFMYD